MGSGRSLRGLLGGISGLLDWPVCLFHFVELRLKSFQLLFEHPKLSVSKVSSEEQPTNRSDINYPLDPLAGAFLLLVSLVMIYKATEWSGWQSSKTC